MKRKTNPDQPPALPAPEISYAAKVTKFVVDENNHLIVTLDIATPSPEAIIGLFDAKKDGSVLDCKNALSAKSLTKLDENENHTKETKAGGDRMDRGRFIEQRN
jgi:hypothetical protein